ncbi:MAG: transporter [Halieaceae bacterium]|nr:transporter [Halieaceae bacterium]
MAPLLVASLLLSPAATSQDEGSADLAQELTNPIANLITLPVQLNFDYDVGPLDEGERFIANIQPVVPFDISDDWNLITRTILPITRQEDIFPGAGSEFGLGDANISLFFSPKRPGAGGLLWGVGPVFSLPTATDAQLGSEKWAAGPGAVGLYLKDRWTVGMLANHVWSFAGEGDRQDVNNTFMQPFVAYTWPSAWTLSVQSETSYNWETEDWSVPVNVALARLVMFGRLPVSLQGGVGYWAESPRSGPEGFRFRLQANFVLPR